MSDFVEKIGLAQFMRFVEEWLTTNAARLSWSVAIGVAALFSICLFIYSVYVTRRYDLAGYYKFIAEGAQRVAIVLFSGLIAFAAFFGHKWMEDANGLIDAANEAITSIDIVDSSYKSEIEKSYFNNSCDFQSIWNACAKERQRAASYLLDVAHKHQLRNGDIYLKACDEDEGGASPKIYGSENCKMEAIDLYCRPNSNIIDRLEEDEYSNVAFALDYFDFDPDETINTNFSSEFRSIQIIKRFVDHNTAKDIFDKHAVINETYGFIVSSVSAIKSEGERIRKKISQAGTRTATYASDLETKQFFHSLCCNVYDIMQYSEALRSAADEQGGNFCKVREDIKSNLEAQLDDLLRVVARFRLQEMESRIEKLRVEDRTHSAADDNALKKNCGFEPLRSGEFIDKICSREKFNWELIARPAASSRTSDSRGSTASATPLVGGPRKK